MQCHARHFASPQTAAAQVLHLMQVEGIAMKEDALARLGQLG